MIRHRPMNPTVAFLATALFLAMLPSICRAAPVAVRDDGGFFSPEAVAQANTFIRDLREKFGKDLVVDTVPGIPADMKAQYSHDRRQQFFHDWAGKRAGEQGVDGVYVLISRDPRYAQVRVGSETKQREFTEQDGNRLRDELVANLAQGNADLALLDAVRFVDHTMAANTGQKASTGIPSTPAPPVARGESTTPDARAGTQHGAGDAAPGDATPAPAPRGSDGWGIITWLFVFAGIFIVFRVIRALFGQRPAHGPGGASHPNQPGAANDPQPGGGGFG
ncbi:MAG: TPM domain-containing protein, partial [Tepidisphaeraceae bacterium]